MSIEEERLQSEIVRNRAERRKLLLEAVETRQRLRIRWYQRRHIVQTTIAGVVAAGLLAIWIVEYFAPILSKETELQSINNEILKRKNERLSDQLSEKTRRLESSVIDATNASQTIVLGAKDITSSVTSSSEANAESEKFLKLAEKSNEFAKQWQDDDLLFVGARARLESLAGEISVFELDEKIINSLMLNDFEGDDKKIQESRLIYLRTVLLLLRGQLDHETAVAIWLAGVDQHNRSLAFNNSEPSNVGKHISEIDAMALQIKVLVSELPVTDITKQVLRWLEVTHQNMRVMRE